MKYIYRRFLDNSVWWKLPASSAKSVLVLHVEDVDAAVEAIAAGETVATDTSEYAAQPPDDYTGKVLDQWGLEAKDD
jgi:hypothetical protein